MRSALPCSLALSVLALPLAGTVWAQAVSTPLILVPDARGRDYELARQQVDAPPDERNNARNRIVITDEAAFARLVTLAKTTGLPGDEKFTLAFFDDIVCTLSSIRVVGSGPRTDPAFPRVGFEQFKAGCEGFDQPGDELDLFVHPESGDVVLSLTLDANVLVPLATTLASQFFVEPIDGTIYSRSGEFDINAMLSGRVLKPRWE